MKTNKQILKNEGEKMLDKQQTYLNHIKTWGEVESHYTNAGLEIVKYLYIESNGTKTPTVAIWKGKQANPYYHHRYQNEELRAKAIAGQEANALAQILAKEERKAAKKAFKHGLNVGDILYSSWGYDQTNVDFYQVTEVNGKQVKIREIAGSTEQDEFMAGKKVAVPDSFCGEEIVKIPQPSGKDCYIKIDSCAHAWPWDGTPKYCSWYA